MYKTHFLPSDLSTICICDFIDIQIDWTTLSKNINKKAYFCKHFDLCKGNLKTTWKLIGSLIKRKTKGQTAPLRIVRNKKKNIY